MAWQDILRGTGYWGAEDVINSLTSRAIQAGDPNYDWTSAVNDTLAAHVAAFGTPWTSGSPAPAVTDDLIAAANTRGFGGPRVDPAERSASIQSMQQYQNSQGSDGLFGMGDVGTLLALAAAGYGGYSLLSGLGGAGAGLGNAAIEAGMLGGPAVGVGAEAGLGGAGMWDWLDELNSVSPWDSNPSPFDLGDVYSSGAGGFSMPPAIPETPEQLKAWGMTETSPGVWEQPAIGGASGGLWDTIKQASVLKSILGGGGISGFGGGLAPTQGGSILGQFGSDPLGAAFNMTPFLLSLVEANRQAGDLNNVIGKINGEGYRRAVLNPYDLDTGLGRTALQNDLQLRDVAGSSFGYQTLGNYDYMRALGRGDLASKANLASAGLEGTLVNQRNTNRNLLLGAGLNASGKMFQPQSDPFNLRALLGV